MRLIALYLPQFYQTPTNDKNWGEGFTEWTNVRRSKPQYEGHVQPRIPEDGVFYDLTDSSVLHRQAALAKEYGIAAFCFYYYRFNGRRELDLPLNNYSASDGPDFPFCICWANEPWTRRWDGKENDVLIYQDHNDADDAEFIAEFIKMASDPRYLRVDGKPVLFIYRPELWNDIKHTTDLWRKTMREEMGVEPYLVYCDNCFKGQISPESIGFDAAYQFPPHLAHAQKVKVKGARQFFGYVMNYGFWRKFVNRDVGHKLFRGVMTSWDNTPRKMNRSGSFHGADPHSYKEWLSVAIQKTKQLFTGDEQIIVINAWNEWAEGAVLEPCSQYGKQYLIKTKEALDESR